MLSFFFKIIVLELVFIHYRPVIQKRTLRPVSELDTRIIRPRSNPRCSRPKTDQNRKRTQAHGIKEHSENTFNVSLHFTHHTQHQPENNISFLSRSGCKIRSEIRMRCRAARPAATVHKRWLRSGKRKGWLEPLGAVCETTETAI